MQRYTRSPVLVAVNSDRSAGMCNCAVYTLLLSTRWISVARKGCSTSKSCSGTSREQVLQEMWRVVCPRWLSLLQGSYSAPLTAGNRKQSHAWRDEATYVISTHLQRIYAAGVLYRG